MKSKVVSISAISSALVAIFLSLGSYVQLLDVFCLFIASALSLLPLYKGYYKASFLTFLGGGVVSVLLSLPTFAFSFIIPAACSLPPDVTNNFAPGYKMHLHIKTITDKNDLESLYSDKFAKFIAFSYELLILIFNFV